MFVDWSARYQSGDTPWEKGKPHPELPFLVAQHRELISGAKSILVPGCGLGHDARFIAQEAEGSVLGLDLAEEALSKAEAFATGSQIDWVAGDLFEWSGSYDLVFEHTCFCAIPPDRRVDYAAAMARLIPVGGHLLGVFFLKPDHEGEKGPPFGVSVGELHQFFDEAFELLWSNPPSQSYPERMGEGRELAMLWKKRPA